MSIDMPISMTGMGISLAAASGHQVFIRWRAGGRQALEEPRVQAGLAPVAVRLRLQSRGALAMAVPGCREALAAHVEQATFREAVHVEPGTFREAARVEQGTLREAAHVETQM